MLKILLKQYSKKNKQLPAGIDLTPYRTRLVSKKMKELRKVFLFIIVLLLAKSTRGQELNCQVTVLSPQIQSSDKKIFTSMQTAIYEFMNNTKWTGDKFLNQERIECSMQITINERPSNDDFKGTIQVQSSRPIFKGSYNSPVFNFNDENFNFRYLEYQQLEFSESGNPSNLTNILAFYAYQILGIDYDTYSPLGGTPYFVKAQAIVNNAQAGGEKGWKAFEGTRNRYWLSENILNPIFKPVRQLYYDYHRKGLDIMTEKKDDALRVISDGIISLQKVHREKPGSLLLQMYFNAKAEEVVNIFSQASPDIKNRVKATLDEIDPANMNKYEKILK